MAQRTKPTVYVVDGDDAVRDSMRSLMASLDVEARLYPSAEALLAEADFETPACVMAEIHLPGMSGLELQERLRAMRIEVPFIAMASRSDVPTAVLALRSGAVDFVEKPFVDEVLTGRIRQVLEAQELERLTARLPPSRREIPISNRVREQSGLDRRFFSPFGTLVLQDPQVARLVAHQLNSRRDVTEHPESALRPGALNALGLEQEYFQRLIDGYRAELDGHVLGKAYAFFCQELGQEVVEDILRRFQRLFIPHRVPLHRTAAPPSAARGDGARRSGHRRPDPSPDFLLERLLLLWLVNQNPAAGPMRQLFDDAEIAATTPYRSMMAGLETFFRNEPGYGPDRENLFELLCMPARSAPDSLSDQLQLVVETQKRLAGRMVDHLLVGLDLIKEEDKPVFVGADGPPPPAAEPRLAPLDAEAASFSVDRSWMPELVLLAKNVNVWLHQLSAAHGREIRTLDQIPGGELSRIAARGFNGLWLVGLWQRSPASRRIKHQAGNPEADASAYSLSDYRIADELGGEQALTALEQRAAEHGIRLACDIVPNHMGIDSPWVIEHPDWFLSLERCPFPSYSFTGEDLSSDPRVGIYLEDHYADRSDAAVVFRRLDRETGEERFIYHGNDGTSLPWNDTAQLDYLNPELREQMIETIVGLARRFPVIRIDAAMTLVKQHLQRLWYPPPGEGGDIPSRSENGLPREEFERRMPEEFWRQVVERVADEAPDALLLAEGFWLLEAYFVRQLGMHRVYNSAFMHLLRDEDNAKLRAMIAETLAFDPRILKRYLNFLTNPDELPAAEQLGTGDKYFALCTLLAALPGLPLFGHGQLEGLAEKYGMEYRRAYVDEAPDPAVVERHERQIVPLLERRRLFAGSDAFRLYDVEAALEETARGTVLDDVIAFSNAAGGKHAVVLVHNRDATVKGTVRGAAPHRDAASRLKTGETLSDTLGIEPTPGAFVRFRDLVSGLEYLAAARDLTERGLEIELGPYESRVLVDFRELRDDAEGRLRRLAGELAGGGVANLEAALQPVRHSLRVTPAAAGSGPSDVSVQGRPALGPTARPGWISS